MKVGIIIDVEASRAIRQAEVGASKTMIERTQERFDMKPERLAGDTAYGSGANLNWLVKDKDIAPHIPVIDKSKREDGTFSREDFTFDKDRNVYICPANKILTTTGKLVNDGETLLYRAKARDCRGCLLKAQCCPKASVREIPRSIYEEARDVARALAKTEAFKQSGRDRKRVEMLFAHLKRILRLGRLRLRGPCGAQFEFTLAAIAQNLRRLASWSPGHHHSPLRALRKRCKRQVKSSVSRRTIQRVTMDGFNKWHQPSRPAVCRFLQQNPPEAALH